MGQVSTGCWVHGCYKYCSVQPRASIHHWPLVGGSQTAWLFVKDRISLKQPEAIWCVALVNQGELYI